MQVRQDVGQHSVLRRRRDRLAKIVIQDHLAFDILCRQFRPCVGQYAFHLSDVSIIAVQRGQARATHLVGQADIDVLHHFVHADGLDDDPLAWNHLHHALESQPIQGLMDRSSSDVQKLAQMRLVETSARPELQGQNAMLHKLIRLHVK